MNMFFRAILVLAAVVQALTGRIVARKAAKLNVGKMNLVNSIIDHQNMSSRTEKLVTKPLPSDKKILSRFCPADVISLVYGQRGAKLGEGGAGAVYETGKGDFVQKYISEAASLLVQKVPASWVELELDIGSLNLPFNLANRDVSMTTQQVEDKDCSHWQDSRCPPQCTSCRKGKPGETGKFKCILKPGTPSNVKSPIPGYECDHAEGRQHVKKWGSFKTYCKCPKHPIREMIVIMPHLSGGDLYDWVLREQGLGYKATIRVGAQLAFGSWSLHAQGVMSRDVKMDNIMKRSSDPQDLRVTHIDYGLAKRCNVSSKPACGIEWVGGLANIIGKKMMDRPVNEGVYESQFSYGFEVDWFKIFETLPFIAGIKDETLEVAEEKVGARLRQFVAKFQADYATLKKSFEDPEFVNRVHDFANVDKHPILGDPFWTEDAELLNDLEVDSTLEPVAKTQEFWTRVCEVYSEDPCLCPGQCYDRCSKEVLQPLRKAYASFEENKSTAMEQALLRSRLKEMRKGSVSSAQDCGGGILDKPCATPYCHSCCMCERDKVANANRKGGLIKPWCEKCPKASWV